MSKISELGPITGANTRSEDLFVIVNLVQGDDGTKNITRAELVESIQYEDFARITITGGTISGVEISQSSLIDVTITESLFSDGEIRNSTFANGEITDSNADNISITNSTFEIGEIIQSTFTDGDLVDSNGDNLTIENSQFNNGQLNSVEGANVALTDSTISDSEIFNSTANNISIYDSSANNITVTNSDFNNGVINNSELVDFDMNLQTQYDQPFIDENSYFALKNAKTGETEQFSYKQFFDTISQTTEKALKVYVDANGDDTYPGTILQPVRTLQRGAEIALEKAGGDYNRNDINNAVHISVGAGTYYLKESIWLPDDCSLSSTAGQYATVIEMEKGYERTNGILAGSGCYIQGFAFQNFEVDNFDYPTTGFGVAYRPGALLRRSPYIRDCSQLSNFNRLDVEPPLQPFNSKGTISDLGTELVLDPNHSGIFAEGDDVTFSSGATGFVTYTEDLVTENKVYVRNIKGAISVNDMIYVESGGMGTIIEVGPEDFPNPLVGRGGGCVLADRRVLDPDSLYTYVLCFGFTPRTQNGMGYVARNGAGINGIGSLSIFVRCAFYALDGGQMTLNNSGTQFGDISMRAKGSTKVFQPTLTEAPLLQNTVFADTIIDNSDDIIDNVVEYITTPIVSGGLGYQAYDATKCERDTGIIVDSVGYDIVLDTNYWGRLCGITYRSPISYVVVNEQLTETVGAINHLKTNLDELFLNADADITVRANTSFTEILNVLENGEGSASPIIFTDTGDVPKTAARELIQLNKEFIENELIDWIEDNDEFFAYNSTKCRRDTTDYILPAVKYDLMLDTNYNAVTAGGAYYMATASKVVNNQKEETISAYTRLRDQTNEVILDTTGSTESADKSDIVFNEIVDILQNGEAQADAITFSDNNNINPNRLGARRSLQNNKTFIQDHMMGYINDQYFIYDSIKCERDISEYILPAVQRDLILGTNFNAIQTGIGYYSATASEVVTQQLTETAGAVEHLKSLVTTNVITDANSITRVNDSFNEIIDIMNNGLNAVNAIVWSDPAAVDFDVNGSIAKGHLQLNKEFLQAEVIAWIELNYSTLVYDQDLCFRDVGLFIDAVSKDIEYGYNNSTIDAVRYYFENTINILPEDQREPTKLAFEHLGEVARSVVQDILIIPTVGNNITQNQEGAPVNTQTGNRVHDLIQIVADVADSNTADAIPVTDPITADPNRTAARVHLQDNRLFIQNEITSYINDRYQEGRYFDYDVAKCSRDVGYVIDAISHDIQYGGNSATLNAAQIYFENAVNILPLDQREPTQEAFIHLSFILNKIVQRQTITPSEGNIDIQNVSQVGANPITGEEVADLALIIANVANSTTDDALPIRVDPFATWVATNYVDSKELIEDEVNSLTSQVIGYISNTYNGLSFPEARCRRDIGLIVDALSHDAQYNTNYATRIAAQIYFENGISVLPFDTRAQTADVYTYMSTLTFQVTQGTNSQNATYTTTPQDFSSVGSSTEAVFVGSLVTIIENVIRNNTTSGMPALQQPDLTWVSQELIDSAAAIESNVNVLADDMIEWINTEFNVLDYNKDKCRRDIGYLLDAFSFDLNYGGNTASRWNADFYYWNNEYRIPEDQREATAKSYRQLGLICGDIVIGEYEGQLENNELATLTESQKVKDLANIFYRTQINNDIEELPLLEQPDMDWQNNLYIFSRDILGKNKISLTEEVIRFVNAEYGFVDINLTRRDAGNLLISIADDFRFINTAQGDEGSQISTGTFAAALFDYNGQHVFPVFNPTTPNLKYIGSVSSAGELPTVDNKPNYAYIVATDINANFFEGDVFYWDGSGWIPDGANNTELLQAFYKSWERMRDYIKSQYSPNANHDIMIDGLFDDVLIGNVLKPSLLTFGSLVESIAHQFNGASAGVNRRALPLNFRNLGAAISASASVLSEDGGRIRWSGADELNNQYFARGLKINGRTGRIEGRPFTSSVRKLARRASNSRASI